MDRKEHRDELEQLSRLLKPKLKERPCLRHSGHPTTRLPASLWSRELSPGPAMATPRLQGGFYPKGKSSLLPTREPVPTTPLQQGTDPCPHCCLVPTASDLSCQRNTGSRLGLLGLAFGQPEGRPLVCLQSSKLWSLAQPSDKRPICHVLSVCHWPCIILSIPHACLHSVLRINS